VVCFKGAHFDKDISRLCRTCPCWEQTPSIRGQECRDIQTIKCSKQSTGDRAVSPSGRRCSTVISAGCATLELVARSAAYESSAAEHL
jgi:hypothetical protein